MTVMRRGVRGGRLYVQWLLLSIVSLFLFYPFMHELGHALGAWLFGGKVVSIAIYPSFCTECSIRSEQVVCYTATAMSGIVFPLLCSLLFNPDSSRGFILSLSVRVMSLAYSVGEMISVSKCILGSKVETADLSVLIYETEINPYIPLILAGFLFILSLLLLVALEPLSRSIQIVSGCLAKTPGGAASRRWVG